MIKLAQLKLVKFRLTVILDTTVNLDINLGKIIK